MAGNLHPIICRVIARLGEWGDGRRVKSLNGLLFEQSFGFPQIRSMPSEVVRMRKADADPKWEQEWVTGGGGSRIATVDIPLHSKSSFAAVDTFASRLLADHFGTPLFCLPRATWESVIRYCVSTFYFLLRWFYSALFMIWSHLTSGYKAYKYAITKEQWAMVFVCG